MNKYIFGDKIANGCFSTVYKAIRISDNSNVIIKQIINGAENSHYTKIAENEIKNNKILLHPQIPEMLDNFIFEKSIYLVFKNHGITTLRNKLDSYRENNKVLSLSEIIKLFNQLIEIIAHIHKHNLTHNDLKPENIIWGDDNNIYIIDFGSSLSPGCLIPNVARTYSYAGSAPEVIRKIISKNNEQYIDVWSFGIIMLDAIMSMVVLTDPSNSFNIEKKIKNKSWCLKMSMDMHFVEYPSSIKLWGQIPIEMQLVIEKCLSVCPTDRPKIESILDNYKL